MAVDIYITEIAKKKTIRLPMLPEEIDVSTGTSTTTYSVLDLGDVGVPKGETLEEITWDGTFPGTPRKGAPYLRGWMDPAALVAQFNAWRSSRATLRVLVTGTPINEQVYVNTFQPKYSGGYGDISYSLSLYKDIDIVLGFQAVTTAKVTPAAKRAAVVKSATYTVVKGDSLWGIAQHKLGNGSRYPELYALNQALIDARNKKYGMPKYTIYAGQVLKLPK